MRVTSVVSFALISFQRLNFPCGSFISNVLVAARDLLTSVLIKLKLIYGVNFCRWKFPQYQKPLIFWSSSWHFSGEFDTCSDELRTNKDQEKTKRTTNFVKVTFHRLLVHASTLTIIGVANFGWSNNLGMIRSLHRAIVLLFASSVFPRLISDAVFLACSCFLSLLVIAGVVWKVRSRYVNFALNRVSSESYS